MVAQKLCTLEVSHLMHQFGVQKNTNGTLPFLMCIARSSTRSSASFRFPLLSVPSSACLCAAHLYLGILWAGGVGDSWGELVSPGEGCV